MKTILALSLLVCSGAVSAACNAPSFDGPNQEASLQYAAMNSVAYAADGNIYVTSNFDPTHAMPGGVWKLDKTSGCWNKLDK